MKQDGPMPPEALRLIAAAEKLYEVAEADRWNAPRMLPALDAFYAAWKLYRVACRENLKSSEP